MNHVYRCLSLFAIAAISSSALGQTVSLDSCRRMALDNNKSIRVAEEALKGAAYDKKAAKAAYLPGIDFSAAYIYKQHKTNLLGEDAKLPTMTFNPLTQGYDWNILVDPASKQPVLNPDGGGYIPTEIAVIPKEALSFDTRSIFAGTVTLTQPVFMGGMIKALNDIADFSEQALTAARNNARQNVIYSVDEAYWTVVSLRAKQRLAQSFVTLVDTLHYNVNAMVEAGVATRSDLLNVDVSLNEARIMLTKVDNGLSLSRMALAQICGRPIDSEMILADEEKTGIDTRMPEYSYDMTDVYSRRQDLEVLRQGINVLQGRERLVRASMLPKVGIVGAYTFMTPNLNDGFSRKIRGGFSIGAGLTIPIWHWGGNYNHYRAAKSATNAQRLLLEDMEEKVQLQVNQAKFKFQEAFKTYDMAQSNMKAAEENLRSARLGFQEGMMTINDVILAQTGWLQAHSEKIDAEIGIHLCEVYLSKVLGRLE